MMRVTQDWDKQHRTVKFDGDIPGGVRIVTPSGITLEWMGFINDEPLYDPKDRQEMFYPGWASW